MLGKNECPEEFILAADSIRKTNPDFEDWQASDQQLLGWLMNSMTANMATQLLHYQGAAKSWCENTRERKKNSKKFVARLVDNYHFTLAHLEWTWTIFGPILRPKTVAGH
uniref:Retrotransposon Copia-like N-terminal domain-containing protein n=1 Tax=Cajanus cajan TaxID=3821 RepID=A0A151QR13_CAJCA|nr:hypothetical protein KK1_046487 [Cajanus cajan]